MTATFPHLFQVSLDFGIKIAGVVTLLVLIRQLRIQQIGNRIAQHANLVGIYRNVFEIMDKPQIRVARRFLYEYHDDDRKNVSRDLAPNEEMKKKVEELVRAFDQLALLVREGLVPVDIVARFYASPAIRCWYILTPYILEERERRKQPGHLWEWENLVRRIISPGLTQGGVWSGVAAHDALGDWAKKTGQDATDERFRSLSDGDYAPGTHLWEIAH